MSDKIPVFACATNKNAQVRQFLESFHAHAGWDVRIVGMGLGWGSYRTKMGCYRDALRDVSKKQVVVCLDAYDALCIQGSAGFLDTFYSCGTPILVGYEPLCCFTLYNRFFQFGCCPDIGKWKAYHTIPRTDPIYVNSGCIVGYAGEIYHMMDWILNYPPFSIQDDQVGVGLYMNEFPHKVKLDLDNRVVFNDNFGERLPVQVRGKDRLEIGLPHKPFFLHFPGIKYRDHKTNYQTICSVLLGVETPLHETVRKKTQYFTISMVVVVVVLLFILLKNDFLPCSCKKK